MNDLNLDILQDVAVVSPLDLAEPRNGGLGPEKIGLFELRADGSWWLVGSFDLWTGNNQASGFVPVFKVAILGQRNQSKVDV